MEYYYKSWPFNESALALYEWAPIAEELKTLDRKIVLNSMILKWDNIKDEFAKLIKFKYFFYYQLNFEQHLDQLKLLCHLIDHVH